nr:polysaccharide deacetylase family protein [Tissierella sp.]
MKTKFRFSILLLAFFLVFSYTGSTVYAARLPGGNLSYMQRGSSVKELQSALNKLGYKISADGIYGPGTRSAVLAFQKKHSSLKNDGLYGPSTRAVMEKTLSDISKKPHKSEEASHDKEKDKPKAEAIRLPGRTLKYLEKSSDVKDLQIVLRKLGYKLSLDGSYGPGTRSAVLNFQKRHSNLKNNGIYDINTRTALLESLKNGLPSDTAKGKIAYLTFDDGPSKTNTPKILKILDDYNIKATFFVLGSMAEKQPSILKTIHEKGHSIGNHSYSHRYDYLYSKVNNFLGELDKTDRVLKNILGKDFNTTLLRFPGGSSGNNKANFRKAAMDKGYRNYDWNALNGDSEAAHVSSKKLIARLKETARGQKELVVLMHDTYGKETTVETLPQIIEYLKAQGYEFRALNE